MRTRFAAAVTLLVAGQATAFTPESGFWWNPSESGRGYSIEIQDNYLFLAAYVYDGTGVPVWFTAQGTLNVTDLNNNFAVYNGTLDRSVNGQCTGTSSACPPRLPTTTAGAGGNFRVDFRSETRATLTWAGGTTEIQRFDYALTPTGGDPRTDALLGQWQLVLDYSPVVSNGDYPLYGDNLIFDRRSEDANEKYVDGCRSVSTATRACSAAMINNNGASGFHFTQTQVGAVKDRVLIAVRDDADEFLIYYLDYGTYGLVKNCPSSIPPSQRFSQCVASSNYTALPVRGLRTRSRSYVAGNNSAPSGATSAKAMQRNAGLPAFTAHDGGMDNTQAKVELDLDWEQVPESAFNELMERMERN
jgi:hypothetical protein